MAEVSGVVRSAIGEPIEGVLVMGVDLNYAETDQEGKFRLLRPEMALFCWCTGYLPEARVLRTGESSVEIVMRPLAMLSRKAS